MATVSDAQLRQLKKYMDDSSLTCTNEWLEACVRWIQENYSTVNLDYLRKELRVQWRDANLEEMESSCLPPNLASQRVTKLSGKYGLQVNCVRDIGESSYNQWTKLKKLENENSSVAATDSNEITPTWQPKPKRCLYLTMTDGKQQVFGMEMQPIPGISMTMKPGFKLILLGPVECRRGVIHLRPGNVRVEGGEVEELLESNNTEQVLAKILKVPSTGSSSSIGAGTQASTSGRNIVSSRNAQSSSTTTQNTGSVSVSGDFPDCDDDQFPDMEAFGDDDIFMEIDEDALINSATAKTSSSTSSSTTSSSRPTKTTTATSHTSRNTNFTEEIEDFEDDPAFEVPSGSNSSSRSTSSFPSTSKSTMKPNANSSSSINTPKTKPVFVPPLPKTTQSSTSSSSSSSATKKNKPAAATSNTSLFSSKTSSSKKTKAGSTSTKSSNNSEMTGFSSAKTALSTSSSNGTGGGKQMKIITFMKPMPVIIDPPTPERRAKRRRKVLEEGVPKMETEQIPLAPPIKIEKDTEELREPKIDNTAAVPECPPPNIDEDTEMINHDHSSDDESLMRIVDEAVENRLSEVMEDENDEETDEHLFLSKNNLSCPVKVSGSPFYFIQQIREKYNELARKRTIVNVRACISTLVSTIKVVGECWTLGVCINDGTGYLECELNTNLLNRIIGFSPPEMKALKATKTKEAKRKISQAMNGLATKLVHLSGIFSVQVGQPQVITDITAMQPSHSASLKETLSRIGL